MSDLRRLIAECEIEKRLTESEANILRMAGKGKSMAGIASLYGFQNADAAQTAVDRIVAKVRGEEPPPAVQTNGHASEGAAVSTPPRPTAPPPASPSDPQTPPRERILAVLREQGTMRQLDLARAAGIKPGSIVDHIVALEIAGKVVSHKEGRAKYVQLVRVRPEITVDLEEPPAADPPAPTIRSTRKQPTVTDDLTGKPLTYDEVFDHAMEGIMAAVNEDIIEQRAEAAIKAHIREHFPAMFFSEDPAASAYLVHLLNALEESTVGTEAYDRLCDRIERVIWGHRLHDD